MAQAIQEFRQRMAERGHKRVEVSVSAEDAPLVRRVAKALMNDSQEAQQLRQFIEETLPGKRHASYKEWLAALPDD
jgi:predicted mannosyl-3-phosphoglycerate phosphatase (HAD superfamily)